MLATSSIEYPCFIHADPSRVFEALVDADQFQAWSGFVSGMERESAWRLRFPLGDWALFNVESFEKPSLLELHCVDAAVLNSDDWIGTRLCFELSENRGGTDLLFSHRGWRVRGIGYSKWMHAWGELINGSLVAYVERGQGAPFCPRVSSSE